MRRVSLTLHWITATRHIFRMCNKLQIPKLSPMRKIIGQHFSAEDFETLWIWSKRISSSSFKWWKQQLLVRSRSLKCSAITFTLSKIMSTSRNLYDSESSIMLIALNTWFSSRDCNWVFNAFRCNDVFACFAVYLHGCF